VFWLRRPGRMVHGCGGVLPAVTGCVWTVRGRELARCEGFVVGNHRCCRVRVCQPPVLTEALAVARLVVVRTGVCRCRRWPRI